MPYVQTSEADRPNNGAAPIMNDLKVIANNNTTIKIARINK